MLKNLNSPTFFWFIAFYRLFLYSKTTNNNVMIKQFMILSIVCGLAGQPPVSAQNTDQNAAKPLSFIGTGDIMLGSNYPSEAKLPVNDGRELLRNVKDILRDADITFGNLEGCILNKGGNPKPCKSGCYYFRMPDRYVNYLVETGYDLINIANNHNGDFGAPGRENTLKILKEANLHHAGLEGICETDIFEKDSVKYGFCGFAPNSGTVKITDLAKAKKLVSELKATCDIVIVSFHGGAEGKAHNRVTRKTETFYGENRGNVHEFAHAAIDAGADIVFGHGPHVLRAAELYKDRFIIYSLGNFCTAGDFSISGISGYAPIVKIFTDKQGKFLHGQIFSFLQKDKTGPVADKNNLAAKEIKRLTELDFPQTDLAISEDGLIERKNKTPQQTYALPPIMQEDMEYPDSSPLFVNFFDYLAFGKTAKVQAEAALLTQDIIDYSKQFLGRTYRRGAKGPNAFDCSGFTSFVFKKFGYRLGTSCAVQISEGQRIAIRELKRGDLIFFKGRNTLSNRAGHVGIVVSSEDEDVTFIHACRRGVIIDKLARSAYYKPRYITGLRVLDINS
jgi:poly-gamma-glutamate capsule biosynthesis protein CapA/YwtB (metallophosphatase superfamily)